MCLTVWYVVIHKSSYINYTSKKAPVTSSAAYHYIVHTPSILLGCADPYKFSQTKSLTDIGLDLLMVSEVKAVLSSNNIEISLGEVKQLTFSKLQEMENSLSNNDWRGRS